MTGFTGSPRTLKGGFVIMDAEGKAVKRTIVFQFNPDTVTRTMAPRGPRGGGGDGLDALRLVGPATETMKFEIELDATDAPRSPGGPVLEAGQEGIAADLAVLETMFAPTVADMTAGIEKAAQGTLEILPLPSPLVLLVLGAGRVLPVRITEFSIIEEAFDTALNPIRASVSVGVSVLTLDDLAWGSKGAEIYLAALSGRERRAGGMTGSLSSLGLTGVP